MCLTKKKKLNIIVHSKCSDGDPLNVFGKESRRLVKGGARMSMYSPLSSHLNRFCGVDVDGTAPLSEPICSF